MRRRRGGRRRERRREGGESLDQGKLVVRSSGLAGRRRRSGSWRGWLALEEGREGGRKRRDEVWVGKTLMRKKRRRERMDGGGGREGQRRTWHFQEQSIGHERRGDDDAVVLSEGRHVCGERGREGGRGVRREPWELLVAAHYT